MPRVSIVMPAYNRAELIVESIQSAQNQTIQDIEILVIDDASTDNTVEVVTRMAAADPRIRLFRQSERQGANAARNRGVANAAGEFINFLDSDDLFVPDKLEKQVAVFERDESLDIVVCQALMFSETPDDAEYVWNQLPDEPLDYREILTRLLSREIGWGVLSPLWRRSFLQNLDLMPENVKIADDRELQMRAVCHAPHIAFMPEALAYVRVHYNQSKRSTFHRAEQLPGRFEVHIRTWQAVRNAGLDTPENRQYLTSHFLSIMRPLASARMVFPALKAWGYAFRVSPKVTSRIQLTVLVLPILLLVLALRRGVGLLKRTLEKYQLESFVNHFMTHRYQAPDQSLAGH